MSFETLDGFPVRFNSPEDPCDTTDVREFCQMAEQDDPLHFAWETYVTGNDVVVCGDFLTELCTTTNWVEGDWGIAGAGGYVFIGNNANPAESTQIISQLNILSPGCWKITVTIPGYPHPFIGVVDDDTYEHQEYAGQFEVRAGNWTSPKTDVTAGTHVFYAEITSGDDLTIVPYDAIIVINEITAQTICCDYSILVKDRTGAIVGIYDDSDFIGTEGIFREKNIMYLKTTWASLGLDDGCYHVCIVDNCSSDGSELILNGGFSSSANWTTTGSWFISGGQANFGGIVTGNLTQTIVLVANSRYTLEFEMIDVAGGQLSVYLGGVLVGTFTTAGQHVLTIDTGASPTNEIRFSGTGTPEFYSFSIDSVTLEMIYGTCSQCYDLKESHPCTKLLKWYNDDDGFGIPYSGMLGAAYSLDYANYLRVTALIEKPRYPQESDRFTYSDGQRKILYATSEKIWALIFDYLPQYIHDSIALAKIHDHFYIDDVEYICVDGNYEPEWRGRLRLAQSKIEIQKVVDNNKNKNC